MNTLKFKWASCPLLVRFKIIVPAECLHEIFYGGPYQLELKGCMGACIFG
jgi:hypothetical protein